MLTDCPWQWGTWSGSPPGICRSRTLHGNWDPNSSVSFLQAKINPVACRVKLLASYKVHPVFHHALLIPAVPASMHQPELPPLPPVFVEGEPEFEVAQIVDSCQCQRLLQYLVDWKGYGPEERSWEDASYVHAPRLA